MTIDTADKLRDANPWRHEQDPVKMAILGKLVEETGELIASLGRCIIQGVNAVHPVSGKPNADWLGEEAIDVANMLDFLDMVLGKRTEAEADAGTDRYIRKHTHIEQWLKSFQQPERNPKDHSYHSRVRDGNCTDCGQPKAAHE